MPLLSERPKDGWQLRYTSGAGGRATDLETAIRDGAASLPSGMVPRLLLVSDGNENLGSAARAIWQAQQLGIPVDTMALTGRPRPGLMLESVSFPGQVFSGERFPVDVTLESPAAAQAKVELSRGRQADRLEPGATCRWRESSAPAGHREFRRRHRNSRKDFRQIAGRGAIRRCRNAAQTARAADIARSAGERDSPPARARIESV